MREELSTLHDTSTWDLVPHHLGMNVTDCHWIFRSKLNADGSLVLHKARLVSKGYHQWEGQDFDLTYTTVVKAATICTIMSIVTACEW